LPYPLIPADRLSTQPIAAGLSSQSPATPDDRRSDIGRIAERISGMARFMCDLNDLPGTSAEVREKALIAFHERIVAAEKHLAHIQDRLRLE